MNNNLTGNWRKIYIIEKWENNEKNIYMTVKYNNYSVNGIITMSTCCHQNMMVANLNRRAKCTKRELP